MAKKNTKKRKKKTTTGSRGRPRVRSGDEVQLTVDFPLTDYAQVAGYSAYAKEKARMVGDSVADNSTRYLILALWREFWEGLPYETRRLAELQPAYETAMKRPSSGVSSRR